MKCKQECCIIAEQGKQGQVKVGLRHILPGQRNNGLETGFTDVSAL